MVKEGRALYLNDLGNDRTAAKGLHAAELLERMEVLVFGLHPVHIFSHSSLAAFLSLSGASTL